MDIHTGVQAVDGSTSVEDTQQGAKARLDSTVLFGKDSAKLRSGARTPITQVADQLTAFGPGQVNVVGYTDDLGSAQHGLDLSRRRANAVARVLKSQLPDRGYRITIKGKGEQDPAVPNTSEANRKKNRRVVITLDRDQPATAPAHRPATKPASKSPPEPREIPEASAAPTATPVEVSPAPTATAPTLTPSAVPGSSEPSPPTAGPARPGSKVGLIVAGAAVAASLAGLVGARLVRAKAGSKRPPTAKLPSADVSTVPATVPPRSNPPDTALVHAALLTLAEAQSAAGRTMPQLAAVEVSGAALRLHLGAPCELEPPWTAAADHTSWDLTRDGVDPAAAAAPAGTPPYPLLVRVGTSPEGHVWMLNLEYHGVLRLTGDADRARDFARYLAAEIACNPWSAHARLDLVGLASEAEALSPARFTAHRDLTAATADAAVGANDTAREAKAAGLDVPTGRAGSADPKRWPARSMFIDGTSHQSDALDRLVGLITAEPDRTGTALVILTDPAADGPCLTIQLNERGRLLLPEPRLDLAAVQLTPAETEGCAALLAVRHQPETDDTAPAESVPSWPRRNDRRPSSQDRGGTTDRDLDRPSPPLVADLAFTGASTVEVPPAMTGDRVTATGSEPTGDGLDADLRAWFSDRCDLPRLTLLGPVAVRAHGVPIARRKPFYIELLTLLALRPQGSTPEEVADALGLTTARVRNDVKIVRDWLGVNPRTGRPHLPDARKSPAALSRGLGLYQVEGLLIDLDLFGRLSARGRHCGHEGLPDLQLALKLVTGRPFDQLRPGGWNWLHEGDRVAEHAVVSVVSVARRAATLSNQLGDPASAHAAIRTAAKAAPNEDLQIDDPAASGQR